MDALSERDSCAIRWLQSDEPSQKILEYLHSNGCFETRAFMLSAAVSISEAELEKKVSMLSELGFLTTRQKGPDELVTFSRDGTQLYTLSTILAAVH